MHNKHLRLAASPNNPKLYLSAVVKRLFRQISYTRPEMP